jgi:hypothetical protein
MVCSFSRLFLLRTLLPFYLIDVASLGGKLGLNDLTLEKLITEINGYKEKMRAIHEDYGRASSDLQDRINVLGYTLNEHLKETKDQMATTPQRLLNLETKYVTGDVNESEYRSQRQEFKGLLEKNLHSIEEIKQMIEVLSHIETKPLTPGEFKQSYPDATKPTLVASWAGAGAIQRPSVVVPPLGIQPLTIQAPRAWDTAAASNEILDSNPQPSTPSAPQNNGNNSSTPQSSNAVAAPEIPTISASAAVDSTPSTTESDSIGSDASFESGPTPDVVEDVADALVVKVVDDAPILEASAAVVTTEASSIQTTVPGTETIPGIQPSAELSPSTLTPPSQFYKVVCPKCGADVPKPVKVWELKGGKSKKNVLIGLFQCQDCRVKFREALTREIL